MKVSLIALAAISASTCLPVMADPTTSALGDRHEKKEKIPFSSTGIEPMGKERIRKDVEFVGSSTSGTGSNMTSEVDYNKDPLTGE